MELRRTPMKLLLSLVADVFALLTRFAVFLGIALVGGIGSAWIMIHSGSRMTTVTQGPWVSWPQSGRVDADPYTRAHTVRLGLLPLNPSLAMTYHARTDDAGDRLYSSCDYRVELEGLAAQWWSLAVFDDAGRTIRNPAQRYAYNSVTVMREPDGKAAVLMARDARPGNWLPIGGAGNVTLALSIQDSKWAQQSLDDGGKLKVLPVIRKVACAR
jgi:hypothetical protein